MKIQQVTTATMTNNHKHQHTQCMGYLRYPFSTKKRFIFLTYNIIYTNTINIQLSNSKYVCSKNLMLFFFTVALIPSTVSKNLSYWSSQFYTYFSSFLGHPYTEVDKQWWLIVQCVVMAHYPSHGGW